MKAKLLIGSALIACFSSIAMAQEWGSGCNTCKRLWYNCKVRCNSEYPGGIPEQYNYRLSYHQCFTVCDTAGTACVQRYCWGQ